MPTFAGKFGGMGTAGRAARRAEHASIWGPGGSATAGAAGAGGAGGGALPAGASEGLNNLVSSFNEAFTSAQAANEDRFSQLLGLADQGNQQRGTDIRASSQQNLANQQAQLSRSGLGGTTIGSTLAQGAEREKQAELRRSGDVGRREKMGIIERRTDTGPDPSMLASAFQSVGTGFGGQGLSAMLQAMGNLNLG